jgi:hypothetical protein
MIDDQGMQMEDKQAGPHRHPYFLTNIVTESPLPAQFSAFSD